MVEGGNTIVEIFARVSVSEGAKDVGAELDAFRG
jgi:hypothetical protein